MFTGLISEVGAVRQSEARGGGRRLRVACSFEALVLGESIAVDGCCLTVDTLTADGFEADASQETLARTTLGALRPGAQVNLERALAAGERLGGHLVSGHVDGLGWLVRSEPVGGAQRLVFGVPAALAPFLAEKGSITVQGVSLTVNAVSAAGASEPWFEVAIIPHTLGRTSLGAIVIGGKVNLEVDLLARYVSRLLSFTGQARSPSLEELLKTGGFS